MISTQTKLLKDALTKAHAIALTNTTIPVLRMVALQGRPENAWLTVTASSLDAQIALDVDSDIDEPLACCVDLGRLLTAIDGQGETTKISMEGERVKVVCGRSVFRLPYAKIEEFPMTKAPAETIAAFPCEWLGASIARVLPFIGDERDPRAYCRGASLKGADGQLQITATNGHSAAVLRHEIVEKRGFDILVPRRIAEALAGYEPTRAIVRVGSITFLGENLQLQSQLIEGVMPDISKFFPDTPPDGTFVAPRAAALAAVKACASVSSNKMARPVRLAIANGVPFIEGVSTDTDAKIELEGSGDDFDIGLQDRAALALIEAIAGETVTLSRRGPERIYAGDDALQCVATTYRI
jgi:DNA polymerase III sliding clamp (beta) subunit (PCNA family)